MRPLIERLRAYGDGESNSLPRMDALEVANRLAAAEDVLRRIQGQSWAAADGDAGYVRAYERAIGRIGRYFDRAADEVDDAR